MRNRSDIVYRVSVNGKHIGELQWQGYRLALTSVRGKVTLFHRDINIWRVRDLLAKQYQTGRAAVLIEPVKEKG